MTGLKNINQDDIVMQKFPISFILTIHLTGVVARLHGWTIQAIWRIAHGDAFVTPVRWIAKWFLVIFAFFSASLVFAGNDSDRCPRKYDEGDIKISENNEVSSKYFDEIKSIISMDSFSMDSLDPFQLIFLKNHVKALEKKLDGGFDINSCGGPFNSSLLGLAAMLGKMNDVNTILERGANIDSPKDSQGRSALILAIYLGSYDVANYLIGKGADMNYNSREANALYALANSINNKPQNDAEGLNLAHKLISNGVSPNEKTPPQGTTPLMMAIITGKPALVKLFMECGADPYIKNQRGRDSFDIARTRDSFDAANKMQKREKMLDILQKPRPASSSCKVHGKSTD